MIPEALKDHFRKLTGPDGPYLLGGAAVSRADGREDAFLTGRPTPADTPRDRPDLLSHRIRVASVTKAATARLAAELAALGALDLDAPAAPLLAPMGYPAALTDRPITLAHLLSHTSGLTDRAGYFTDPPESLPAFLTRAKGAYLSGRAPGAFFTYANLNLVLAGALIEAATGERYDRLLARHVLSPLGIAGGPNWAGVADRARRLPLYERYGDAWRLEIDGPAGDWGADILWRGGAGLSFAGYRPGLDTHLLSPHAGLRLTLAETARLARAFGDDSAPARDARTPRWTHDGTNGDWAGGLFPEMGLALTTFRDHPRVPGHFTGHAGHALGFTGGAWFDHRSGAGFAYAFTGSADETAPDGTEAFFPEAELAVFRALAAGP